MLAAAIRTAGVVAVPRPCAARRGALTADPADLLADTLAGRPRSARALIDLLYPVVQARVARVLMRSAGARRGNARQEVDDLTQEVFASLFEHQGRALRSWDPQRGLSLPNFVGLLAERCALSILRSGRRTPFSGTGDEERKLDGLPEPGPGPEPAAMSRQLLELLLDRLRLALSPLGFHLFQLLYVEERSPEEVAASARMSSDAVYAWRSRLRKLANHLAAELAVAAPAVSSPGKQVAS
jgi:RNA polymerase sigma factor (sigma-70 family)